MGFAVGATYPYPTTTRAGSRASRPRSRARARGPSSRSIKSWCACTTASAPKSSTARSAKVGAPRSSKLGGNLLPTPHRSRRRRILHRPAFLTHAPQVLRRGRAEGDGVQAGTRGAAELLLGTWRRWMRRSRRRMISRRSGCCCARRRIGWSRSTRFRGLRSRWELRSTSWCGRCRSRWIRSYRVLSSSRRS